VAVDKEVKYETEGSAGRSRGGDPERSTGLMLRFRRLTGRARLLRLGLVAFALVAGASRAHLTTTLSASLSCPNGTTLDVVAHEDDSVLFMSPDLLHDIKSGRCVRSVFVTAGDDGLGKSYWGSRETGAIAAYAKMAGVSNNVTTSYLTLNGHQILVATLSGAPKVSLIFMRLPDGNLDGTGFSSQNNQSLQKLYTGENSQIAAVDGSATYTKSGLTTVLTSLMNQYRPDHIDTQDFVGTYGDDDHSDHYTVAYLARDAHRSYTTVKHTLVGYMDYGTESQPANVTGSDFSQKDAAWLAYSHYDSQVCQTDTQCMGTSTWAWLSAQYTVGSEAGGPGVTYPPTANAGPDQTVLPGDKVQLDGTASSDPGSRPAYKWTQTAGAAVTLSSSTAVRPAFTAPSSSAALKFQLVVTDGKLSSQASTVTITVIAADSNLAPYATVTASSEDTSTGQLATKAVDGVIDGWPGDATREWATVGGGAGSWLKLSWTSSHTIAKVILYDRPNGLDQITSATLTFSNGSTVHVGALNNDGTRTTVTFPAATTSSLLLTVDSVSGSTQNIGLAEIQLYAPGTTDMTPKANAGQDQTVPAGSTVQLDGSASTDPGSSPSYKWTQTAGPAVTLSSGAAVKPTFTAPASATTLTFQLVVSDNHLAGQATVTITVIDPNKNLAADATVTASSENTSTGQLATKAIDGVVDGYPGDYTHEWATAGGGAGSWLKLVWTRPQTVGDVVLHDRPNASDQITSVTLTFSDGTTVHVGALNNDGSATVVTFPAVTTTSLLLTVDSVSASTANVGLAEIQVYAPTS
jgi:LmbE family N-acetylglucosaminyl deacetylase